MDNAFGISPQTLEAISIPPGLPGFYPAEHTGEDFVDQAGTEGGQPPLKGSLRGRSLLYNPKMC